MNMINKLCFSLVFICFFASIPTFAVNLNERKVNEDDLLLLSAKLNHYKVSQNIDAYKVDDDIVIAVEPLFEALLIKYQLLDKKLVVWKNEQRYEFDFLSANQNIKSKQIWANDDYYIFVHRELLAKLFNVEITYDARRLSLALTTTDYQFPLTVKQQQDERRLLTRNAYSSSSEQESVAAIITIPDQYRLATLPHGQISASVALDDNDQNNSLNVQLVSDLLYHSANININKSKGNDVVGGLSFARYKSTPDDLILGAFDQYRFGDISSTSGSTLTSSNSGVGVHFSRAPENYRRTNNQITLQQNAPAGWEAELFHNNRFIELTKVPDTGVLVFDDVDIQYGANDFVIKVYGPFGEKQEFKQSYKLDSNPLSANAVAYSLYTLDPNNTLFDNEQNSNNIKLGNFGGVIDYGISDLWQMGFGFDNVAAVDGLSEEDQQIFTLKNNLSFPGLLFENELSINDDSDYIQQSSLSGNVFSQGAFNIQYNSSNGIDGGSSILRDTTKFQQLSATYYNFVGLMPYNFSVDYSENDTITSKSITNSVSYNFSKIKLTHNINYFETEFKSINEKTDNLFGNLNISALVRNDFRLSASINYDPGESNPILNSSSLNAQYNFMGPWGLRHYFTANYRPLIEQDNDWQLSYNASWEARTHRLSLQTRYDTADNWAFSLNLNFFFGYDYHNNRATLSSNINTHSGTLNVHSYLDRQLNGVSDVLDYGLEGVSFTGNQYWDGLTTGKEGKILLPGAPVNTPFRFQANWLSGAETINKDYVIYTHPGARVDVNMPFYLSTELAGFVMRINGENEVAVKHISVELIDSEGKVVNTVKTDIDGYYEFTEMKPDNYTIKINQQSLRDKFLTTDILGYRLTTPSVGGYIELPLLALRRLSDENDVGEENTIAYTIDDDDIEAIIWDEDNNKLRNYFSLPTKGKVSANYEQDKEVTTPIVKDNTLKKNTLKKNTLKKNTLTLPLTIEKASALPVVSDTTTLINGYTLQLGAFNTKKAANVFIQQFNYLNQSPKITKVENSKGITIYRVYLGEFESKQQAKLFANNVKLMPAQYLIKGKKIAPLKPLQTKIKAVKNETNSSEWVIQLLANQSSNFSTVDQAYSKLGKLFIAQKTKNDTGELWYCLISKGFPSKQAAKEQLSNFDLKGWVISKNVYTSITPLAQ
jgi:hypothetical protein